MKTTRRTQLGKTTALLGLVGMLAAPAIQAQQQPALDCSFRGDPIAANDAVSFHHILNQVDKTLTVEVTYQGEGWVGFGISQDGLMPGSQVVIAKPDEAQGSSNPGNSKQTLTNAEFVQAGDGTTVLRFTKALAESGELEILADGPNTFVFAAGSSNTFGYHLLRGSIIVESLQQCVEAVQQDETPSPTPAQEEETPSPSPSVATAPPTAPEQADDLTTAPTPTLSTIYPTPYVECPNEYAAFWSCVDTAEAGDQDREACDQCLAGYWPGPLNTCGDVYNYTCGFLAACPECGGASTGSCQDELDTYMNCRNGDVCAPVVCSAGNNDDAGSDQAPAPTEAPQEPTPSPWGAATVSPSTSAPTRWPECPEEKDAFQSCVERYAEAGDPQNDACTSRFVSYWPANWECNEFESLTCGFSEACPECGSCENELAALLQCATSGACGSPVICSPSSPGSSPIAGDGPTASPTLGIAEDPEGSANSDKDDQRPPVDVAEDEQGDLASSASMATRSGLFGLGLALMGASTVALM